MLKLPAIALASVLASSAMTAPARAGSLPFIPDDYAKARAEARKSHLPLFVEVWAPW